MNLVELTTFLGWATIINSGILLLVALILILPRGFVAGIHGSMFSLSDTDLDKAYFQYLGQFKIAIIVLNLTPWIALKIMA